MYVHLLCKRYRLNVQLGRNLHKLNVLQIGVSNQGSIHPAVLCRKVKIFNLQHLPSVVSDIRSSIVYRAMQIESPEISAARNCQKARPKSILHFV